MDVSTDEPLSDVDASAPLKWPSLAIAISAEMETSGLPRLGAEGLAHLARDLFSLWLAKRLCDSERSEAPAEVRRKAEAIGKAAASLRTMMQNDTTNATRLITAAAEAFLWDNPTGLAGDSSDPPFHPLGAISYQAPFARTDMMGVVNYTALAPLSHLYAHLQAIEMAAAREVVTQLEKGRGVRKKEFRGTVIAHHLPALYAVLYPTGGKGTYNPVEGTRDGPLYRFVQMASEALGYGLLTAEAIRLAIRREQSALDERPTS